MKIAFDQIIDDLSANKYAIVENFISQKLVDELNLNFDLEQANFKTAGISKNAEAASEIRGDRILWIDESPSIPAEIELIKVIHEWIVYLNQTCYLGIKNFEFHYAEYPAGKFYKKHIDQFKSDESRILSMIVYLNKSWTPPDGGELKLYLENEINVAPESGKMVCFFSDKVEHEVLITHKNRRSITGWLKR